MKNILKISIAALASAALLSGCIKETFPTDRATSDQLAGSASALEAMVKGIPTALIQVKSLTDYGNMHWNFSLPAIHLATDSAAGHNGRYGLRLVQPVGRQRCSRRELRGQSPDLEQLFHLDQVDQRHHQHHRPGSSHDHDQAYPRLRLRLPGFVLPRPGTSL